MSKIPTLKGIYIYIYIYIYIEGGGGKEPSAYSTLARHSHDRSLFQTIRA